MSQRIHIQNANSQNIGKKTRFLNQKTHGRQQSYNSQVIGSQEGVSRIKDSESHRSGTGSDQIIIPRSKPRSIVMPRSLQRNQHIKLQRNDRPSINKTHQSTNSGRKASRKDVSYSQSKTTREISEDRKKLKNIVQMCFNDDYLKAADEEAQKKNSRIKHQNKATFENGGPESQQVEIGDQAALAFRKGARKALN